MTSTPLVSIIIVSWNALETIRKCLPSVVQTDFPSFEVLFADNASTDGSAAWVRAHFPAVRVIEHPENWAFCRGNNEAAKHANGQILVLLNNDVEVPPNWLGPLTAYLDKHPQTAIVGPRILDYRKRDSFEYAGAAGGFIDNLGYPFTRGRIFSTIEKDDGQYDDARQVFWASGTCLAIRHDVWQQAGGFDERFFMHMEEIDLCWRVQRMGYHVAIEPSSRIYHMGGASLAQGSPQKTFLNYRNNLLLLLRNAPSGTWPGIFVRRLLLDGVEIVRSLLSLKGAHAWAILRAYAAAHSMKQTTRSGPRLNSAAAQSNQQAATPSSQSGQSINQPAPIQANQPIPLPYRRSIVWDYFIRGRKKFSDLPQDRFRF